MSVYLWEKWSVVFGEKVQANILKISVLKTNFSTKRYVPSQCICDQLPSISMYPLASVLQTKLSHENGHSSLCICRLMSSSKMCARENDLLENVLGTNVLEVNSSLKNCFPSKYITRKLFSGQIPTKQYLPANVSRTNIFQKEFFAENYINGQKMSF
jgi:hypothetical protein